MIIMFLSRVDVLIEFSTPTHDIDVSEDDTSDLEHVLVGSIPYRLLGIHLSHL